MKSRNGAVAISSSVPPTTPSPSMRRVTTVCVSEPSTEICCSFEGLFVWAHARWVRTTRLETRQVDK